MICFEIRVNGERKRTTAVRKDGVLIATVRWRGGPIDELQACDVMLSAIDVSAKNCLGWPAESLRVGDVLTVTLVEQDEADLPTAVKKLNDDPSEPSPIRYWQVD